MTDDHGTMGSSRTEGDRMRGCVVGIVLLVSACGPPWGPPPDPRELMDADRAFAAETVTGPRVVSMLERGEAS